MLEAATQVCDLWYQAPTARESERALRGVRFGGATDTADTAGAADAAASLVDAHVDAAEAAASLVDVAAAAGAMIRIALIIAVAIRSVRA